MENTQKRYIAEKLNPIMEPLITELLVRQPEYPIPHMIEFLQKKLEESGGATESKTIQRMQTYIDALVEQDPRALAQDDNGQDVSSASEDDDEDDDEFDMEAVEERMNRATGSKPRFSVSAEAYGDWNKVRSFVPVLVDKSVKQRDRLKELLTKIFMFSNLEELEQNTLIDVMKEKVLAPNTRIIQQGDDGDTLYAIEAGQLKCLKRIRNEDGTENEIVVKVCEAGDIFGELALLYNCPRAASVESGDQE
eukprot:GHVU01209498.1.p1 GENE.GHVU01209498.1~~GHVU01209498.1.p1  ORF type:complete len:250 (-),score=52.04 GHVU01209498.1:1038-1787(-)